VEQAFRMTHRTENKWTLRLLEKNVLTYTLGYISLCYAAGASSQAISVYLLSEYNGKIQCQGDLF
jgi:hypothetical protein